MMWKEKAVHGLVVCLHNIHTLNSHLHERYRSRGGALISRISALVRVEFFSSTRWRQQKRQPWMNQEVGPHQMESASSLILDFPVSRIMSSSFLELKSYPAYGFCYTIPNESIKSACFGLVISYLPVRTVQSQVLCFPGEMEMSC
jgi:hypothetical protein